MGFKRRLIEDTAVETIQTEAPREKVNEKKMNNSKQ